MTKLIVFDLDETLGYFTELGFFLDCVAHFLQKDSSKISQEEFNAIMDLYPEFLRPKILPILNYLKYQKVDGNCYKMMIYTNNNAPKVWAQQIIQYLESKLKFKLFDQIISAFKVNGKQIELLRTTHNKHYNDLVRCTKVPNNAEIFFLDNTLYPEMLHESVYYVHLDPYYFMLPFDEMIKRFISSNIGKQILNDEHISKFENSMKECWQRTDFEYVKKKMKEYRLEKIVSKEIMILLQKFFKNEITRENINKPIVPVHVKTRKRRVGKWKKKNRTQKEN
jgi:hypothetical protein